MDEATKLSPVDETKPAIEETKSKKLKTPPASVAFRVNIVEPMKNASFSLDTIDNSSVAEALGQIFDECAGSRRSCCGSGTGVRGLSGTGKCQRI
jgi:hypothetical protein